MNDEMVAAVMREQGYELGKTPGFAPDEYCDELRTAIEERAKALDDAIIDGEFVEAVRVLLSLRLFTDAGLLMFGVKPTPTYSQMVFCGLGWMNREGTLEEILESQGWKPNTHAE